MSHLDVLVLNPLQKKKFVLPSPLEVLTSKKTTAVLAGTLGALLFPAAAGRLAVSLIPKTIGGKLLAITGISALTASPKLRTFVVKRLDPVKTGREIGGIIEDPGKLLPTEKNGVFEKIKEFGKTAGLVGAGAAAGAGLLSFFSKTIKGKKSKKDKEKVVVPEIIAASPLVATALPSAKTVQAPLGAVQPLEEPVPDEMKPIAMPSIKITNKPKINIRFSKSRKFINQQVLVKR